MCEQIFKKRQRPNTIQILWIVKNQEKANVIFNYLFAAIKKDIDPVQFKIEVIRKIMPTRELLQQLLRNKQFWF